MMSEAALRGRYQSRFGERVGSLVLCDLAERRGDGKRVWGRFRCDCGTVTERAIGRTLNGWGIAHCGCQTPDRRQSAATHGMRHSPEYSSWRSMRERCCNTASRHYPRYGGKGVNVCAEWDAFEAFYAALGPRPAGTTLDRIDNERGYEPGNCRWATPKEQARNRRVVVTVSTPRGVMLLCDYAPLIGISNAAAHLRLRRNKLEGVARA